MSCSFDQLEAFPTTLCQVCIEVYTEAPNSVTRPPVSLINKVLLFFRDLSDNELAGPLPEFLAELPKLKVL